MKSIKTILWMVEKLRDDLNRLIELGIEEEETGFVPAFVSRIASRSKIEILNWVLCSVVTENGDDEAIIRDKIKSLRGTCGRLNEWDYHQIDILNWVLLPDKTVYIDINIKNLPRKHKRPTLKLKS